MESVAPIAFETRERPSGLLVPPYLAGVPEGRTASDEARDTDGRRRVVLPDEDRRLFYRLVKRLGPRDLAFFLACRTSRQAIKNIKDAATGKEIPTIVIEPIDGACGEVMLREGENTPDPGYGCKCTRVHFVAAGPRGR